MLVNSDEVTLTQSKELMNAYQNGERLEKESDSGINPYYSETNYAPTKHYAAIIVAHPNVGTYFTPYIEYIGSTFDYGDGENAQNYNTITPPYGLDTAGVSVAQSKFSKKLSFTIETKPLSQTKLAAVCKQKISPNNTLTSSEARLYYSLAYFPGETVSYMETYARGDVNHDGLVNDVDVEYLMKFLINGSALDFDYTDRTKHCSYLANVLAADVFEDGAYRINDAVMLQQIVAGTAEG